MEMRRRGFLLGAAAGACGALGERALPDGRLGEATLPGREAPARAVIAPPGSDNGKRLRARCTGCNLCVAKCPTNVLKAATLEYGLSGTMMPVMDFARGSCDKDCTRCGEVCPTGAIRRLSKEERAKTKIGQASLVAGWENLCLAHKENYPCGLCAKHCPYGAITMVGEKKAPHHPSVDARKCVGCGACLHVCPAHALEVVPV